MLWSRKLRRPTAALLLAAMALSLPACGFQPLYRQRTNAEVSQQLAAIQIRIIADRPGQQLRTLLQTQFNPSARAVRSSYTLSVTVSDSVVQTLIRKDETATRANLTLTAEYQLSALSSGELLVKGRTRSTNSFNILDSEFATLASEQDARNRAVRNIGAEIQSHLAIFFQGRAQRQKTGVPVPYGNY